MSTVRLPERRMASSNASAMGRTLGSMDSCRAETSSGPTSTPARATARIMPAMKRLTSESISSSVSQPA
jgi:hypothetical protein